MDEAVLRKLFVGREKLLKSVFKEIEDAARKKTPRFVLIVGPRGIGKSHFLVLLYHEIKNKLGSVLVPIKLREEEYSVYRASDFFLRILEEKKEDTKDILSLAKEDDILHAAIEKLKLISKRDGKRYIIFIENLHELFKQLELKELQKLRSIFQKYDFFSVVASAPLIFPGISEHDEPFYNFFEVHHLNEFSLNEIKDLIQKIAKAENNTKFLDEFEKYEPKIHGMAHLTGGSPRLVILFYEMITRGELENIENAFFKIIDEHTPYYQEIFQLLTGQKRRIFDAVISSEAPITPKQLSRETRLDLPTVTTQLRRLETDGYVISRPMGRYTKYEVRERLFRLWREMRQPLGRKRVSILLEFLQYWYTPEERKELFRTKFEMLEAGEKNVLKYLCYITETLSPESKTEALLKLTPKLIEFGEREEAAYEILSLKEAAIKIGNEELDGKIPLFEADLLISEKKFDEALNSLNKSLNINPSDISTILKKCEVLTKLKRNEDVLDVLNNAININPNNEFLIFKGVALLNLGRFKESLDAFNKAIERKTKDGSAFLGKGIVLGNLGKLEEAIEYLNKAIEINPKYEFALSKKSEALISIGKYEEALDSLNKLIEINPKDGDVLSHKGVILGYMGRYEEAIDTLDKAMEIHPNDVIILSVKGAVLVNLGRNKEALDVLNKAIEIKPNDGLALSSKGAALVNLERYEEALDVFNKAIKINPNDANALSCKGIMFENLSRHEEAIEYLNKAIEINPNDVNAMSKKGIALVNLDREEEALEVLNTILKINPNDATVLSNIGIVLGNLGRYEDSLDAFNKAIEIDPKDGYALSRKGAALGNLERYKEALDAFKNAVEIFPKDEVFIEDTIETCFNFALDELKAGNRGISTKFMKVVHEISAELKEDKVAMLTINFLKSAADSGDIQIVKVAVDEIIKLYGNKYEERIKPIIKAIEIVETKDIQKYYNLQIEEREIVGDVVKKITKSDELLPEEIKRKESRLTDFTDI